jgi:hypothetical protein
LNWLREYHLWDSNSHLVKSWRKVKKRLRGIKSLKRQWKKMNLFKKKKMKRLMSKSLRRQL